MTDNERDTKFLGFAKLLYDEIGTLDTWNIQRFNDYTSFDVAAKTLIAQRAYDLAYHALYHNGVDASYRPGKDYHPTAKYERKVIEHMSDIPDLTEWPITER